MKANKLHVLMACFLVGICACGGSDETMSSANEEQPEGNPEEVHQQVTEEVPKQFFGGRLRLEQVVGGEVVETWDVVAYTTQERFFLASIFRCEDGYLGWCGLDYNVDERSDTMLLSFHITEHIDPPGKAEEFGCNGEGTCKINGERLWYERDLFQFSRANESVLLGDELSVCEGASTHEVISLEVPAGEGEEPNVALILELAQRCDTDDAPLTSSFRLLATGDPSQF
jgi:hypothetical protein